MPGRVPGLGDESAEQTVAPADQRVRVIVKVDGAILPGDVPAVAHELNAHHFPGGMRVLQRAIKHQRVAIDLLDDGCVGDSGQLVDADGHGRADVERGRVNHRHTVGSRRHLSLDREGSSRYR